jgi:YVTN family beta-propeller protein
MYVVLEESDAMDVIDTSTFQVMATVRIGQQLQMLVYVPNAVPHGDGRANRMRQGLPPNSQFTVYLANDSLRVPAATFATNANGVGTALAFVKFFGTFTQVIIGP